MRFYINSILAGFSIGIAAICYLKGGSVIGAALFAFGLSAVIYSQWPLFTGKAGFFMDRKQFFQLLPMLICNIFGTWLAAQMGMDMNLGEAAAGCVDVRVARGFIGNILPAVGCGFIMSVSVRFAKEGKWIPLLLGIPTFVISGFPHCIADIAYYTFAPATGMLYSWLGTVLGNFIGCNLAVYERFLKKN
ncbi:MAG: formate/nitrite transporter family protein [Bacteroidales bacterium]|nr:formate/nitrite transporter family protein [Bacteroidales bacterium]